MKLSKVNSESVKRMTTEELVQLLEISHKTHYFDWERLIVIQRILEDELEIRFHAEGLRE